MSIELISAIAFPLLLLFGTVFAWRASKKQHGVATDDDKPEGWRDTSLDDWRKQRDLAIEAEREARARAGPKPANHASTCGDDGETKKHQRIGG